LENNKLIKVQSFVNQDKSYKTYINKKTDQH